MTHPTKPTVPATKSDREMFREWHEKQFGGEPTPSSTLCSREWEAWTAATAAQSEKLRVAVEALEFYANKYNWKCDQVEIGDATASVPGSSPVDADFGDRAAEALTKLKESK